MRDDPKKAELRIESNSVEHIDTELLVKGMKKGTSTEFHVVNILVAKYKNEGGDNNHGHKEETQGPIPTQHNERKESGTRSNKEFDEERVRNWLYFCEFKRVTIQMIFISALTILAVEWQPLRQLVEEWWFFMVTALAIVVTFCVSLVASIKLSKTSRFRIIIGRIYCMLGTINLTFKMADFSVKFTNLSSYWVVLAAATVTSNCLFITVLIYFQKTSYRDWSTYIFAALVPLLFLFLSQFCYYMWFVSMSYEDFMINVWLGIGLATLLTFGKIVITQLGAKGKNAIVFLNNGDILLVDLKTGLEPQDKSIPANI